MSSAAAAPCPPTGARDDTGKITWVHDGIYQTQILRWRDMLTWKRAELYDQCYQYLMRSNGVFGFSQWVNLFWSDNVDRRIPMPVFNFGFDKRINESARLGRPAYRPVVSAKGANPDLSARQGAQKSEDMLRHRLKEMGWAEENDTLAYHVPLYGGAWTFSWWDERWDDVTYYPVLNAKKCPTCPTIFADEKVPTGSLGLKLDGNALRLVKGETVMDVCPTCADHPPLQNYKPSLEEARGGKDSIGRPLGTMRPRGDWVMKIASPYDVFPLNMGLDQQPGKLNDFTYVHIEHLDWVRAHWPEKSASIRPDDPSMLSLFHPVGGAPDLMGSLLGAGIFRDMVRVKERHRAPAMVRFNAGDVVAGVKQQSGGWTLDRGRSVIVVNEVVVFDGDWLMPSRNHPGEFVPRATLDYAKWEPRDGGRRIQGLSQWEIMFSPQDTTNEVMSQTQSVRRTCAVPVWLADRASNFELSALEQGLPGFTAEIDVEPGSQLVKPELINNMTIAAGVQTEIQFAKDFLDRVAPQAEGGQAQPGVDSAKANKLLIEESGEKREPRIKRIKQCLTRGFTHGALLQQHMYAPEDAREFQVKDEDGNERWVALSGLDIGTQIVVEVEPEEADKDAEAMAVEKAITLQVLQPTTSPQMQRKIAEKLGVPVDELFEAEMLQDNQAKREYCKFRDEGRVPVVDPTLDNSQVHVDQHGRDAMSEWFRVLEDKANWDQALQFLAPTWLMDLQMVSMAPPVPGQPQGIQDKIIFFWSQKLMASGFVPPDAQALMQVLAWRAHMEAHRLEEERRQQMAQLAALMAAPAGPQTPGGRQVHPGAAERGRTGGPGAGDDAYSRQVAQQQQVRTIAAQGGETAGGPA